MESGSALEQRIRENQDFSVLRDEEKQDKLTLPAQLRVWWRKAHPEGTRSGGKHQIVVTFSSAVMAGSASVDSGSGSISNFTVNGSQLTLNLQNVTDAQKMIVTVNGASDGTNVGNLSIPIGFLLGDASGDGFVNSADTTLVRNGSGSNTDATNFRLDVNWDGTANSADATITRSRSGQFVP
ncbi:MAG: dockerin type I repeat-containing protein [Verrucomicrobiota bacterium]|nr:dockerin type I repeat-containing protein [Verrucomicrobiota bacterium]